MTWPSFYLPELLLTISSLLLFLHYYSKNKQPNVPVYWPVVGMMPSLILNLNNLCTWCSDLLRLCQCNFYFRGPWFSDMNVFVTCDPLNIQHIFTSHFQNYPKGKEFSEIFDVFGDALLNIDGEKWQAKRLKVQQLLSHPRFRAYVAQSSQDKMEKAFIPFLAHASKQGRVIDMQDVCLRLTFSIFTKLILGLDSNCLSIGLPTIPFTQAIDDVMETCFSRHTMPISMWKLLRRLNTGGEKRLANAWSIMDQFIEQAIEERRVKKKEANDIVDMAPDLLSSLIGDNETSKDDKFLRDTTIELILAGRDTTAVGLTWFLWLLTQNRHVEGKILDELNSIPVSFGSNGVVIFSEQELAKLVYLHAALNEALRLFPPIPFECKAVLKDDMLPSGFLATPGIKIVISSYSMARMESVWGKDCLEFKPERWISENNRLKYEPSYKFLSFNTGPRTCLGKGMAFTLMKAAAATLVYNFYFEVIEGHVTAPKRSIILHMKNGLMVKVKKRSGLYVN